MKAIVCEKYGPPEVLKLKELPKPVPGDDEVLIKVFASSINSGDHRTMRAKPFFIRFMGQGFLKPKKKVPGIDLSGRIEQAGKNVKRFKAGDEVFGDIYQNSSGAYEEYVCVKEDISIVKKPAGVTFEQAAAVPVAGTTALQALRDHGGIKSGQEVLINGASGGVGTFCVILAKAFGASVTGVCSTKNKELISSIGADYVIDYTKQDPASMEKKYDLIIDVAATLPIDGLKRILRPGGTAVLVGFSSVLHMMKIMRQGKKPDENAIRIKAMGMAQSGKEDLTCLGGLIDEGKILPVIDRVYPLEQTEQAMRYFEEEHASAKVIIKINEDSAG